MQTAALRVFPGVDPGALAAALAPVGIAVAPADLAPERHDWRWYVRLPEDRVPRVDDYPLAPERLRAVVPSLPAEIHERLHRALDRYAALTVAAADRVLVHGDLGTHNLAFDPATRRVVGLYDFESFAYLDRHHD